MRVTRVRLKNWKNFSDVDVRLAPRTFLVGINAVGKSNFLDALWFMHDVAEHGLAHAVARRGGMGKIVCLHARKEQGIWLAFTLEDRWEYELEVTHDRRHPALVAKECVREGGRVLLDRPNKADGMDRELGTQTALEQVAANRDFRELADFFGSIEYVDVQPQLVRDPRSFFSGPVFNDPFGRDLVRQIWRTPKRSREARLARISKALRAAIPTFQELRIDMDESLGEPRLRAPFAHQGPDDAVFDESALSDGTIRLLALFWALTGKGGPLLLKTPERSLNENIVGLLPRLLARLACRRPGRQVLVSTHSFALLDEPGIQPEEVGKLLPDKEGTLVLPVSKDAEMLMANGLSAAEAVLPEINIDQFGLLQALFL